MTESQEVDVSKEDADHTAVLAGMKCMEHGPVSRAFRKDGCGGSSLSTKAAISRYTLLRVRHWQPGMLEAST